MAGRIALGIEYDGAAFNGWQTQRPGVRTVQECLEAALGRVAAGRVRVHCAGRTDTGVHASGQVVHFDARVFRPLRSWVLGANANLPADVCVRWARQVPPAFHARFRATGRHYRYEILNRPTRSALYRGRAVWIHRPLDAGLMHQAGQALVGRHDFSSYRALGCQAKSPEREVHYLRVTRSGERIRLEIGADGFLHHMVRNIAGVLLTIGKGERPPEWAAEVLRLRDRTLGGVTAPPEGLTLVRVDYPEVFALPDPEDIHLNPW